MPKASLAKLDVLVVDPSAHMAAVVAQMLRHLKVSRVDEALDADRAALLLQSHRYGAIIMNDALMPIDGVALVQALRRAAAGLNRDTPVVMMASAPDATRIAEARDAGITEFLRKPFAAKDVGERLAAVLAAPRRFVETDSYAGPDRRRKRVAVAREQRRRSDS